MRKSARYFLPAGAQASGLARPLRFILPAQPSAKLLGEELVEAQRRPDLDQEVRLLVARVAPRVHLSRRDDDRLPGPRDRAPAVDLDLDGAVEDLEALL